jgi:hypothetical protein
LVARLGWDYPRKTTANEEGVTAFGEKVNSKNGKVNEGVVKQRTIRFRKPSVTLNGSAEG